MPTGHMPASSTGCSVDQRLIHFVDKDCWCEGFAYSDLRRVRWALPVGEGSGPALELRFVEAVITDVRIEGRNLEDIHYWISEGDDALDLGAAQGVQDQG